MRPRQPLLQLCALLPLLAACAVGLGQPCDAATPCPAGLTCAALGTADGGTSAQGLCDYPLRLEGEPCTRAAECDAALTCSVHLTPGTRDGRCTPRLPNGSACFTDRDCQSHRCQGSAGTAPGGTCAAGG